MIKRLFQGFACAVLLAASGSVALAADWKIARLTGGAWILAEGKDPVPAAGGMVVPKGSTVSTGRNGRVMLVHNQDTVMVGPGTLVGVPHRPDRGVSTTLVQQVGEVELAVQKRGRPHFSVQTPFLAAVVKGTEFSVVVSEKDATVRVDGGLVAVQDLRSGERADVGAGQSATATRGGGLSVSGTAAVPEVRAGRPQKPSVPALGSAANPDAHSSANPDGGSNGNGNGNSGNGNGNGGGDGSNAGGNGNGNPGGNGNGNGNGNSGNGNGNGGGDGSNAGGNGNPGGNGNGNGNGNSGNGNGNGGGDGSNAGGNGNGNPGGNGNGNGNGNANGIGPGGNGNNGTGNNGNSNGSGARPGTAPRSSAGGPGAF
jgi:hypothetical protein